MRGMEGTCRAVLPSLHIGSIANEMTGPNVITPSVFAQEKSTCYEPSAINFHLGETPPRELWEREQTEFAARPRHAPDRSRLFPSRRQLGEAADHGALPIRQRIDHSEMIHAGDGLVAGLRAGLAPAVGDDAALAQELARLQPADDGVERAVFRRRPEQRRDAAGLGPFDAPILRPREPDQ